MAGYKIWFKSEMKVIRAMGFRSDGVVNGTIGMKLDYDEGKRRKQIELIFDKDSFVEFRDLSLILAQAEKLLSHAQRKRLKKDVSEILKKWDAEPVKESE